MYQRSGRIFSKKDFLKLQLELSTKSTVIIINICNIKYNRKE